MYALIAIFPQFYIFLLQPDGGDTFQQEVGGAEAEGVVDNGRRAVLPIVHAAFQNTCGVADADEPGVRSLRGAGHVPGSRRAPQISA